MGQGVGGGDGSGRDWGMGCVGNEQRLLRKVELERMQKIGALMFLLGLTFLYTDLKSHLRPTRKVFVYKIQVIPIHTMLKYGDYYDFIDR